MFCRSLEIGFQHRRSRKDPAYYNYLSERSQRIFERKVEVMFFAEIHDYADAKKHIEGVEYAESIFRFMRIYDRQDLYHTSGLAKQFQTYHNPKGIPPAVVTSNQIAHGTNLSDRVKQ